MYSQLQSTISQLKSLSIWYPFICREDNRSNHKVANKNYSEQESMGSDMKNAQKSIPIEPVRGLWFVFIAHHFSCWILRLCLVMLSIFCFCLSVYKNLFLLQYRNIKTKNLFLLHIMYKKKKKREKDCSLLFLLYNNNQSSRQ